MLLKPYAWLDFESRKVHVNVKLTEGSTKYQVSAENMDTSDSVTIFIVITVTTSSTDQPDHDVIYSLPGSSAHKKVKVLVRFGTVVKGSVSLRINNAFFDGPLSPLCWLRQTSVPETELHVHPYFPSGSSVYRITGSPSIVRDPDAHKITITCQVTTDSGSSDELVQNFSAEDMSVYEFVELKLKEGETPKGKGTTTQSEADSSDDT